MPLPTLLNQRYRIVRALGEGSFGQTFLAIDTQLSSQPHCVIKQLKPTAPDMAKRVSDRFAREAAALAALGKGHAQIPSLYAYFETKGQFYLVQEWVDGSPLLASSPWTETNVVSLLQSVLSILVYVHSQGMIHRDIKPTNILLRKSDRLPVLIDFGAVKAGISVGSILDGQQASSMIVGTPGYMPLEQAMGQPQFSSDLYSLGMTAIYLLTTRSPTEIPTDSFTGQLLWQQYTPNISLSLTNVLAQATNVQPQNRYKNASEMRSALVAVTNKVEDSSSNKKIAQTALSFNPIEETVLQPPSSAPNESNKLIIAGAAVASFAALFTLLAGLSDGPLLTAILQRNQSNREQTEVSSESQRDSSTAAQSTEDLTAKDFVERGLASFNTGDKRAAIADFDQAIALAPKSVEAYLNRAIVLESQGQEQAALQDLEAVLEIAPETVEALGLKGDILLNQVTPDIEGAIATYTKALTLAPNSAVLFSKRCGAFIADEQWTQAEADCSKGIAIASYTSDAATSELPITELAISKLYEQRGDVRKAQQNYTGAELDYSRAIEINVENKSEQSNKSLYFRRHEVRIELGDLTGAQADLQHVKTLR